MSERDREKAMITHSDRIKAISITQGGTLDVPVGTWLGDLNDAIAAALAEERERCARIVERAADDEHGAVADDIYLIADEIRSAEG